MRTAIVTGFDVLCANHRSDLETTIYASGMIQPTRAGGTCRRRARSRAVPGSN
jgi:hypothetical protein